VGQISYGSLDPVKKRRQRSLISSQLTEWEWPEWHTRERHGRELKICHKVWEPNGQSMELLSIMLHQAPFILEVRSFPSVRKQANFVFRSDRKQQKFQFPCNRKQVKFQFPSNRKQQKFQFPLIVNKKNPSNRKQAKF